MHKRMSRVAAMTVTVGIAAILSACVPTADAKSDGEGADPVSDDVVQYTSGQEIIDAYDVTKLCGDEPIRIAFPVGIANPWMKVVGKLIQKEADKCDNIDTVEMVDAQNDSQKAVSDVNSLVARGVDGIVTMPLFGEAQIPSFRSAMDADVPVTTFISDSGGVVGQDVAAHVSQDYAAFGKGAEWLEDNLKKGTVVFLGNAPGQPSSIAAFEAFKERLGTSSDIELVEDEYQVTNNSAVEKKRVMTAMLAKHGRIDAVVTDAGAYDVSVIEAYEEAGMELPYLVHSNSTNSIGCEWEKNEFPLYAWDGSQTLGVVAFRHLLSVINDIPTTEPTTVKQFVTVDTVAGQKPKCDESMPPGVEWSVPLSDDELRKVQ